MTVDENWLPHLLSYVKFGRFSDEVTATLDSIDDISMHITCLPTVPTDQPTMIHIHDLSSMHSANNTEERDDLLD
jgi:hypothetical protein